MRDMARQPRETQSALSLILESFCCDGQKAFLWLKLGCLVVFSFQVTCCGLVDALGSTGHRQTIIFLQHTNHEIFGHFLRDQKEQHDRSENTEYETT